MDAVRKTSIRSAGGIAEVSDHSDILTAAPERPAVTAWLDSQGRQPLYRRLREDIVHGITSGTYDADQRLPSDNELARQYGVAIGTVRKAIESLVIEGLVVRYQGRGTFLRRPDFASSLFRFFRIRRRDGAPAIPQGQIRKVELLKAAPDIADGLDATPGTDIIRIERLRLFDDRPILKEVIFLPKDAFSAILDLSPQDFPDLLYPMYESRCAQIIASASETLTLETADADDAAVLDVPLGSAVISIARRARGYDGQILEWRRSRGAPDHFRYEIEIR